MICLCECGVREFSVVFVRVVCVGGLLCVWGVVHLCMWGLVCGFCVGVCCGIVFVCVCDVCCAGKFVWRGCVCVCGVGVYLV